MLRRNRFIAGRPNITRQLTLSPFPKRNSSRGRKVVEIEREKFAVSRDASHQLHVGSAVCPHMKCIVNWNHSEQTWDLPLPWQPF
ncbi:Rieske 2Fe-2S domain-containing protein [Legionella birminghamensis]|uniref:Rieske 2Fe-2S domain-containing protein n=1 Tax=Legionella birminghamensis TaxID=28083 RepID=UPI003BF77435